MKDLASTIYLDGLTFGEAPRWHEGRLWYSDFFSRTVFSVADEGAAPRVELEVPGRPSGLGWLPDGALLVVSMQNRTVLRRDTGGDTRVHADLSEWATGDANDMLVGPGGHAYVGHFGFDLEAFFDGRSRPAPASVLGIAPDGTVGVAAGGMRFPNGMVQFGTTLVVAETFAMRLSAFEVDSQGDLHGRHEWAPLAGCAPDGICGDADGAVWTA